MPGNRSTNSATARTRRDYTYIDDIIQGVMAAFEIRRPMFDIFNLGENQTIELRELIAAIEKALGRKAKINQMPEQPGDVPIDLRRHFKSAEASRLQSDHAAARRIAEVRRLVFASKKHALTSACLQSSPHPP